MTQQEYEVSFEYILGKKNSAADAHSRNIKTDESTQTSTILCNLVELIALDEDLVRTEQRKEEPWKGIINYLENTNLEAPRLPGNLKLEEFTLIERQLYRNTDLSKMDSLKGRSNSCSSKDTYFRCIKDNT